VAARPFRRPAGYDVTVREMCQACLYGRFLYLACEGDRAVVGLERECLGSSAANVMLKDHCLQIDHYLAMIGCCGQS